MQDTGEGIIAYKHTSLSTNENVCSPEVTFWSENYIETSLKDLNLV